MIQVVVVGGPTASGKTALGIEIAKKYGGEIVSADSMQIYKYMDIGSAKPTESERAAAPHHMIDIVEPTVNYSLGDYVSAAKNVIADIHARGNLPVIVGGTGLYINTLINNITLDEEEPDMALRRELETFAKENGNTALHEKLAEIDPEAAEEIHPNNVKRVIRAIEIFKTTGLTKTQQMEKSRQGEGLFKACEYGIWYDREVLYERINRRVDIMIEEGLIEEVENCLKLGCTLDNTSMQGIGYKEVIGFLNGQYTLPEMTEKIKQESRRYAKRQITWFKRNNITWLAPGEVPYITFTE